MLKRLRERKRSLDIVGKLKCYVDATGAG